MKTKPTQRQLRRGSYLLPTLFTTGNLFFGFFSLVATLRGDFRSAALAIGISLLLDGLDGRIARMTNTQTDFGNAFDSLADVIAFGLSPALLAFGWGLWNLGRVGWLASFFFVVCAAARLARFTVQSGTTDRRYFAGLPTPPAAGLLASLSFFHPARIETIFSAWLLVALLSIVALLMISKIRYLSFKEVGLQHRQPYTLVALLGFAITMIAFDPPFVLLLIASAYVASGPAEWTIRRLRRTPLPKAGPQLAAKMASDDKTRDL